MPPIKKPSLVNRTAVGTYQGKLHQRQSGKYGSGTTGKGKRQGAAPVKESKVVAGPINNIHCDGEVVDISTLVPDPMNARLHPERNLQAIMDSLSLYGQRSPLVVREQDRMIAAGNGRLQAMKALGWTKCAVSMRPMTDKVFMGYALADNRTAELAKWDFEVVARLDALILQSGGGMPGWSKDELEVLRAADWTPPPIKDDENFSSKKDVIGHTCPKCGHKWEE